MCVRMCWIKIYFFHRFSFAGAIFTDEHKDSSTELAFKYAVYRINKDKNILPKTTLIYDIQHVPIDDSFRASKKGKLSMAFWPLFFSCLIYTYIGAIRCVCVQYISIYHKTVGKVVTIIYRCVVRLIKSRYSIDLSRI